MSKSIEKNFNSKLTKKDYFLYLINRNLFIIISPLVILALIVIFIFMVMKNGFNSSDLLYLLPILLFVLSYIQINNAVNTAIKSNKSTQKLKVILEEKRYKEITSNGENSLEYSKFNSYYENKNYYYLYVDRINALILPKREFTNDELFTLNNYFKSSIKKTTSLNPRTIAGLIFSLALVVCIIILIVSMF